MRTSQILMAVAIIAFSIAVMVQSVQVGATWTEEATLRPVGGQGQMWFGWSVVLSADGGRALVGAPRPPGPPKSQALPDKIDPRQGRLFAD